MAKSKKTVTDSTVKTVKTKTTKTTVKTVKANKLDETEIVVVLDRSGSMQGISQATVDGFNKFLNEQQNSEGKAFLTLIQFDDRYEVNYSSVDVKKVQPLVNGESFVPRGGTALLDALGKTIEELKTDRDVVFVIITDGEENASKTYSKAAINKMIESLQKDDSWKFVFLAANQDAIAAGNSIGIKGKMSMNYAASTTGTSNVFASMSSNISSYRGAKGFAGASGIVGTEGLETTLEFSDSQRDESMK